MDEGIYSKGLPPYGTKLSPDFCFGHWQTQCRATYEAPVDPHVVLGGFPNGPSFRNFSADATSFVVTYPVDSSADNRRGRAAASSHPFFPSHIPLLFKGWDVLDRRTADLGLAERAAGRCIKCRSVVRLTVTA